MKTTEKRLQGLTETKAKINTLLAKDRYSESDIAGFTEDEKDELAERLTELAKSFKSDRKKTASFYNKIEPIVEKHAKNQIWESNHINITAAIATLMPDYGRMPSKNEIADFTGLSRQNIHKHITEYVTSPIFQEQVEQFRFIASKVLARVFTFAINGDVRAARLYFDIVGNLNGSGPNNTFVHNQNNYIQINGMVLNQESITRLNPQQLMQIEEIFKAALSKPKDL
jgi:hypothetical protein